MSKCCSIHKSLVAVCSVCEIAALSVLLAAVSFTVVFQFFGEPELSISTAIAVGTALFASWVGAQGIRKQTKKLIEDNEKLKKEMKKILEVQDRILEEVTKDKGIDKQAGDLASVSIDKQFSDFLNTISRAIT